MFKVKNFIVSVIRLGVIFFVYKFVIKYIQSGEFEKDMNSDFFQEGGGFEEIFSILGLFVIGISFIFILKNPQKLKKIIRSWKQPISLQNELSMRGKEAVKGGDGKTREFIVGKDMFYYIVSETRFREKFKGLYGFTSKQDRNHYLMKIILQLYGGFSSRNDTTFIDTTLKEETKVFLGDFIKYYRDNQFMIEKEFE